MNDLDTIDINGETFRLGTLLPDSKPDTLPRLSAAPGFRVWSSNEIAEAVRSKPVKRRAQFAGPEWICNQQSLGSCFPPGTLVRMGDGSQKPIEEVRLLDPVLTAEGRVRRVMRTMVRPHAGSVYRLKVWGHRHLRATGEHPILTRQGYVPVEELTKNDWVALPKFAPQTVASIVPMEYVNARGRTPKVLASVNKGRDWLAQIPGKSATRVAVTPLPELITLDRRFGRLVGLFLAEGCVSAGKVTLHFHTKERETLVAEVVESFRDLFGVEAVVVTGRGNRPNNTDVKVYGTLWAEFFTTLCATGSGDKRLHRDLAGGPLDFLEGVLGGWKDGDGLGDRNSDGGVTISHSLAMNMYDIASVIGHRPTVETLQVKVNPKHKIKARRMRYIVRWPKSGGGNPVAPWSDEDDKHVWRKVVCVEPEPYSGFVYNLEVEHDHSYVAESVGVHNCNCAAAVGALRRAMTIAGRNEVPPLSWEFLYAQLVDGVDQGSMLDDGMHALANGVPVLDTARHPINRHYRKRDYSAEDYADARNWRAEQCYQVDTEAELATLLLSGQGAGVVAVHVGSTFAKLYRKGFAGVDYGPGNHAVMVHDVEIIDNRLAFDHGGSWGLNVHDQGYAYLDWSDHLAQTNQHHAFYAIVAANNPGGPSAS